MMAGPTTPTTVVAAGVASVPSWLAPAVLAALLALVGVVVTLMVNGRRARTDRQRALFADAFGDIAAYREFVYIVRRRRHDEPEAERVRISGDLSAVQQRLNRNRAVLTVEAPRVAAAFGELLDATRRIAGGAIREGWNAPAIKVDTEIHVDIDLTGIDTHEAAFLLAAGDHLAVSPAWSRRARRWCARAPGRTWRRLVAPDDPAAGEPAVVP